MTPTALCNLSPSCPLLTPSCHLQEGEGSEGSDLAQSEGDAEADSQEDSEAEDAEPASKRAKESLTAPRMPVADVCWLKTSDLKL